MLCQFFVGRYQTKCLWESSENIFCLVVIKRNARGSNLKIFLIKLLFALLIFCWLLSNKMLVGVICKPFFFLQFFVRFVNFLLVVIKQNACWSHLKIFFVKLLFALSIFLVVIKRNVHGSYLKIFLSSYCSFCQFFVGC